MSTDKMTTSQTPEQTTPAPQQPPSGGDGAHGDKKPQERTAPSKNAFAQKFKKISALRRFVLLGIIVLFLLQFLKLKVAIGGLSGSFALWFVNLIDVFAYFESLVASRTFVLTALVALIPIAAVYLIFGRAFCGWVCPMDYLFELVDKIRKWKITRLKLSPKFGYLIAGGFLIGSFFLGVPLFTNYFSHLTNFFRALTGGVFFSLDLPVVTEVVLFSAGVIVALIGLEFAFPRLWCRYLCPVGKTYGLFNKVSLLKMSFDNASCAKCKICERACYMGVDITSHSQEGGFRDINCIYCGRCTEVCATKKRILKMKFSLPKLSKK